VAGCRLAVGANHAPPGQSNAVREHIADRSRGARKPGATRHLAITDHLAARQVAQHGSHGGNKGLLDLL